MPHFRNVSSSIDLLRTPLKKFLPRSSLWEPWSVTLSNILATYSVFGFVENTGTDLRAGRNAANHASSASNHSDGYKPFVIAYERTVTSGSYTFYNNSNTSSGFEESNSGVQTAGPNISSVLKYINNSRLSTVLAKFKILQVPTTLSNTNSIGYSILRSTCDPAARCNM